jgi:hypothetical protein
MTITTKAKTTPPAKTATKTAAKTVVKKVTAYATELALAPAPVPAKKMALKTVLPVALPKLIKAKKLKLVRDSFTIPKQEYLILDNLKLRAADLKQPVKKGELLRAGIKALEAMTDKTLLAALKAVPVLKSGRPSK